MDGRRAFELSMRVAAAELGFEWSPSDRSPPAPQGSSRARAPLAASSGAAASPRRAISRWYSKMSCVIASGPLSTPGSIWPSEGGTGSGTPRRDHTSVAISSEVDFGA